MADSNSNRDSFQEEEVVILGICRDVSSQLTWSLDKLKAAFGQFKEVHFRVVESDSSDSTVEILEEYKANNQNFDFESLGNLELNIPHRWERIAFCRNSASEMVRSDARLQDCKWVVVADLDGINSEINSTAVASCWIRNDWEVCTANQSKNYHDVFALRHVNWSPNDCWGYETELIAKGLHPIIARERAIYGRQKKIPSDVAWIAVESAFGGLAIYKRDFFILGKYVGKTSDGIRTCEHVTFNKDLREAGARIYINPSLINSGWNEHNSTHLPKNRLKRRIKLTLAVLGLSNFLTWFQPTS